MKNTEDLYLELSDKIIEKESKNGIEGLSQNERNFYLVDSLLMELNNGGFDQYFLNWTGKHWQETVSILDNLGISFLSNLFKTANEIYRSDKSEDDILDDLNELDNEFYNNLNYEDTYEKVMKLFN
ncbi:DMP19 family protein [Gottfriedia acidiceleris]|uniref:DMP19 family protein n=1 Tax=Gottfriedia acidiceleris TaxID=371036 RepID=UPI002FFE66FF